MPTSNCIFCRIVAGESASQTVFQDDHVTAFHDIRPVAPTHILIVPNQHIESINNVTPADEPVIGHLFTVARALAEREKIDRAGYRLIINTGPNSGQAVFHLHVHLIGGQRMRHPMG